MARREGFQLADRVIPAGRRATVDLPMTHMSDHTPVALSVHVVHGQRAGPVLFVSAAVHGDEVVGVEIVRRLLRVPQLGAIAGTLLAVPIVNSFGFLSHSRYLPDRRDLNRSFPGSATGSMAARLAHLFRTEILMRSDCGIDLHSAGTHRSNLAQVRISPGEPRALDLAQAFAAPVTLTSRVRDGSLRATARALNRPVILYEAGEGLRLDEASVRMGVAGILRVMAHLGMLAATAAPRARAPTLHCGSSEWLRAPAAGLLQLQADLGARVAAGQVLATISDPFGETEAELAATRAGIIVGRAHLPLVNEGDALFHLADLPAGSDADPAPVDLADEDEII
jgi:hypothetical protein